MTDLDRRQVLAAVGAGAAAFGAGAIGARPAFAQESPHAIEERLTQALRDGRVSGLRALLVSQGSRLVFEYYGRGAYNSLAPGALHDLRSVTKSVVALLYGIALAAGKVPPPDAKLYDQFPEYADLGRQPGRERITVRHALSMTLGLEWDELDRHRCVQQRPGDGSGARPIPLRPRAPHRRRTRRNVDLLRRRHRAARPDDRQGHRREPVGLCPPRSLRSAGLRSRGMDRAAATENLSAPRACASCRATC